MNPEMKTHDPHCMKVLDLLEHHQRLGKDGLLWTEKIIAHYCEMSLTDTIIAIQRLILEAALVKTDSGEYMLSEVDIASEGE